MDAFKDLFSQQSAGYARFRPSYPDALYDWLATQAPSRGLAVDLGCGSGQAAGALASRFAQVSGVDPSQAQLDQAPTKGNIRYVCARAETTGLAGGEADLVTVAQAFHWFQCPAVFDEIRRLLKPGGVLAIWCYHLARINPAVDDVVRRLYHGHLGPFWDPGRRLLEDAYHGIDFPKQWAEIDAPRFSMHNDWSLPHLIGFLSTWSSLKPFKEARGFDALEDVLPDLEKAWGAEHTRAVDWPLSLRIFKL